ELSKIKVPWYACYQETHNKTLYQYLRQGQSFSKRVAIKKQAKNLGMLIEEGVLTGMGESLEDLADSIIWMKDFSVDQARVMTFVPQTGTPMEKTIPQDDLKERIIIAVMRLVLPDTLIPASLDVGGLDGLKARLTAGANVVTSIVPPEKGLAGVANHCLDIEDSRRTLKHILPILKTCGLKPALPEEYQAWVTNRQNALNIFLQKKEKIIC
ncbi:MAG: methylornithine synthase PylB, partial [Desulfobacula sp.]|nr:methylornithine synthase PylB [Desulfobacula sp.]